MNTPVGETAECAAWNETIAEFRALGGVADNICRRQGRYGIGLHVEDPSKPYALMAPERLLVPVEDVAFQNGVLTLRPSVALGERERSFFESYQARFSWGAQGRRDVQKRVETLSGLPESARAFLIKEFHFAQRAFEAATESEIEDLFLRTRLISYKDRRVLMPVLDLVNFGAGASFRLRDGIAIEGTATDEILVTYGPRHDPFRIFLTWGFAAPAPTAFAWPLVWGTNKRTVRVLNRVTEGKMQDGIFHPIVSVKDNQVTLSHLMLAHRRFPDRPRAMFAELVREAGFDKPDAIFDGILRNNRRKFLGLLEHVENADGQSAAVLRSALRHQLTALS